MESLSKNKLLQFNPDTLQAVRKLYGLDKPKAMDDAINIFEEWIKKQNHFVKKDFERDYLERTIILASKGSVERAKGRLDKICTLRTLMPDFFVEYDIKKDFANLETLTYTPMPKLTKEHERIIFVKNSIKKFDSSVILDSYKFCAILFEYLRAHDYAQSYIFVCDLLDTNMADLVLHMNPIELRQFTSLLLEGYGVRVKGIHLVSTSKLIDALISIMKQVLSTKLSERIHLHKTIDTVYDYVPKEVLPSDYGGEGKSLAESNSEWIEILNSEEFKQYKREMDKACTNETCRQTDTFNEQYMGMPGTFRTLSVD